MHKPGQYPVRLRRYAQSNYFSARNLLPRSGLLEPPVPADGPLRGRSLNRNMELNRGNKVVSPE